MRCPGCRRTSPRERRARRPPRPAGRSWSRGRTPRPGPPGGSTRRRRPASQAPPAAGCRRRSPSRPRPGPGARPARRSPTTHPPGTTEGNRMSRLVLLPAVDVADGQAVRLVQGEAGSATSYGSPLQAALDWQAGGAEWIHLVDLDAAFGRGSNSDLLAEVVAALDVHVEMSGGIRDNASLDRALATGCSRVNLGTAALEDPQWTARAIARHGDAIAVGLDVRGTTLAARGWTREGGDLWEA